MKKLFIILTILFTFMGNAFATDEISACTTKTCGNAFTKGVSNVTGMNFLSTKIAELIIQKSIKKYTGSSANVEIYPFTIGHFFNGEFRKITIDSKRMSFDGFFVSSFKAESICNYNHISIKDNDILFKENFSMNFSGKITNGDLRKTILSPKFRKLISNAKISILGQTALKISYMDISVNNNKLNLKVNVMSPIFWGAEQKTFNIATGINIVDGKIKFKNIDMNNSENDKTQQQLSNLINLANPFILEIKLSPSTYGYTKIKNVIINNGEIQIDGILFIPKNS